VINSGFTDGTNEFATLYRAINWYECNCRWSDVQERFDYKDFLWCPRQAGSSRQFECTLLTTAENVVAAIEGIPKFIDPTGVELAHDGDPQ